MFREVEVERGGIGTKEGTNCKYSRGTMPQAINKWIGGDEDGRSFDESVSVRRT